MNSSPFLLNAKSTGLPVPVVDDYSNEKDIVEFGEIEVVRKIGEGETDFIVEKKTIETNRYNRQDYINSFRNDVGILNIIEKVRLSGDATLFMQNNRTSLGASGEVDSLGRDLEPIVDVTKYQVDKIEALETIKNTRQAGKDGLPEDLTKGLSFDGLAQLSDENIDKYFAAKAAEVKAAKAEKGDE